MAFFGGAIALSALALFVTLTKSSVETVENSLTRIFSGPAAQDPVRQAAIPPLPQAKPDNMITGSIPRRAQAPLPGRPIV